MKIAEKLRAREAIEHVRKRKKKFFLEGVEKLEKTDFWPFFKWRKKNIKREEERPRRVCELCQRTIYSFHLCFKKTFPARCPAGRGVAEPVARHKELVIEAAAAEGANKRHRGVHHKRWQTGIVTMHAATWAGDQFE